MVSVPATGWYRIHVKMVRSRHADPEAEVSYLLRNFLVVSIGDSYASGEGVPDRPGNPHGFDPGWSLWDLIPEHAVLTLLNEIVEEVKDWLKLKFTTLTQVAEGTLEMDTEPTWLEKEAHRSLNSGPALAARLLEDLQQGDVVSFLSFARSGAEVWKGLLEPRRSGDLWAGGLGQLDELQQELGDQHIDALLISVGGNDIGFSGRLADLVGKDSPSIWMLLLTELSSLVVDDSDENRERVRDMIEEALLELDRALVDLADAVGVLNVGQVYLTEYPMAMFDQVRNGKVEVGSGCEIFSSLMFNADIDSKDAKLIKEMGQSLNDKLKAFCDDKPSWFYVDGIAEGFAGHGYCTGDESFYVRAEESFAIQGDGKGTMHPNAGGLAVYARRIAEMVREHTIETRPVFDENGKPIDTSQFESGVLES